MPRKINIFRASFLVFFGLLFAASFAVFAIYGQLVKKGNVGIELPTITVWGTLPHSMLAPVFGAINEQESEYYEKITYVQKNRTTIYNEYVRAAALGRAPDILFLSQEQLFDHGEFLQEIPFGTLFTKTQYIQTFVPAAQNLLTARGYVGVPFLIDPLILYYNENLRLRNSIREMPRLWSDFLSEPYLQSIRRTGARVDVALIPFGTEKNYRNAVDVFFLLLQQSLDSRTRTKQQDLGHAMRFFADFSNPSKKAYTWSTSLPRARDLFIGERLLFYPGFASEYVALKRANPNLVLRTQQVPRVYEHSYQTTVANLYAFAVTTATGYTSSALTAIGDLVSTLYGDAASVTHTFSLPPAIRGLALPPNAEPYWHTFVDAGASALPVSYTTYKGVFRSLVHDLVSGAVSAGAATTRVPMQFFIDL